MLASIEEVRRIVALVAQPMHMREDMHAPSSSAAVGPLVII